MVYPLLSMEVVTPAKKKTHTHIHVQEKHAQGAEVGLTGGSY